MTIRSPLIRVRCVRCVGCAALLLFHVRQKLPHVPRWRCPACMKNHRAKTLAPQGTPESRWALATAMAQPRSGASWKSAERVGGEAGGE